MIPNALGSAAAGIISRVMTHPLDTAKARLQNVYKPGSPLQSNPYKGPIDVLLRTVRTEGIKGLYRGFGAVLVGGTPGTMIYLCSYEIAKTNLARQWERQSDAELGHTDFFVHFSAGMFAESISCIIYVPVDVVKERMQVQRSGDGLVTGSNSSVAYKSSWDALKHISRSDGLSGVYKGYGATLASFGSFSALYFAFYEKLKYWSRQYVSGRTDESARSLESVDLPFSVVLLSTASSGALASWLTSPLDMAKLRLQVQRGNLAQDPAQAKAMYRGVFDCLQLSYREAGMRGLFRGAGARVLHFTPATAITMTLYETCRSYVAQHLYVR